MCSAIFFVSVSSGWIVGVKLREQITCTAGSYGFSILWVDRGGETAHVERIARSIEGFSILWVDRGGETLPPAAQPCPAAPFQYPLGGSWG